MYHYSMKKSAIIYGGFTGFLLIFGIIYNQFGHGVTSPWMSFAFLWTLFLGMIPAGILALNPGILRPRRISVNAYNSGVACIAVSSVLRGIFEIAGNASLYQGALMVAGWILLGIGVVSYLLRK